MSIKTDKNSYDNPSVPSSVELRKIVGEFSVSYSDKTLGEIPDFRNQGTRVAYQNARVIYVCAQEKSSLFFMKNEYWVDFFIESRYIIAKLNQQRSFQRQYRF